MYELLVGIPPFYHEDPNIMRQYIQTKQVKFPNKEKHGISISQDCCSLITKLLIKDKDKRISGNQVLNHPFFKGINTESLLRKEILLPYHPDTSDWSLVIEDENTIHRESIVPSTKRQLIADNREKF